MKHIFYHGTSSLFLRSIHKYGLGGINPNKEWKLLELLVYLYEISESRLQGNKEYAKIRDSTNGNGFSRTAISQKKVFMKVLTTLIIKTSICHMVKYELLFMP